MARGKHGAEAARRRYESALDHIDRLSDTTADAKLRAKQSHALAAMVPGLQAENRRLRDELDAVTSPALERERAERAKERDQYEDRLRRLAVVVSDLVQRLDDVGKYATMRDVVELDHCLGDKWRNLPHPEMSRDLRRTRLTSTRDLMRRIPDQDLRDAGLQRVGDGFVRRPAEKDKP